MITASRFRTNTSFYAPETEFVKALAVVCSLTLRKIQLKCPAVPFVPDTFFLTFFLKVELIGLEPTTLALQTRCSPN